MSGSLRQRGLDSWELRVDLGVDADMGRERWATKTVHGTRRHASAELAVFVEEADYARLRGGHRRRSVGPLAGLRLPRHGRHQHCARTAA